MAPDSRRWLNCGLLLLDDFHLPIELGQAEHRHLHFAGQPLQPPGDLRHLLLPRIAGIVGLDQLQVVDDDQPQIVAPLQPAGVRRRFPSSLRLGESSMNSGAWLISAAAFDQLVVVLRA